MSYLDRLVRENRFTIAVFFPFVGGLTLLLSAEGFMPEPLKFNPFLILFGTFIMRLPLVAGLKPLINRKSALGLAVLTLYTYLIEFVGVSTGFPYGEFSYGIELGPMILGIPLALPIFYLPLVVNAYLLSILVFPEKTKKTILRVPLVLIALLIFDAVLDPAAVAINFWNYSQTGFYGVPLSNFLGWILTGLVSIVILDISFDKARLEQRLSNCEFMLDDVISFVFLWGLINLYFANIVPTALSLFLGLLLIKSGRFDSSVLTSVWKHRKP